ncbi:LuxR family transcriptional regulator [Actinoallomurus bryophytorum]|uniref:Putative ATPase n=2 Tax=Actinoallomurus bryophytorum TaxID=1490222 RepID=A0A543CV71_9ACTN|nr:putative ATPase [Actinoallomurus bryophytorum]
MGVMVAPISAHRKAGNLPADVTSYIGQRRLVSEARRLISAARLLTFTGPGGIGKSRLSLRVATEVRRAFSDGVWIVELADLTDEELVGRTVATTLGLRDQSDEPPIDVLLDYLADKQTLLVLDNCEHLLDGAAILARKLLSGAPQLRIIATSRQPLCVEGEHVLQVPPLTTPAPDADCSPASLAHYEAVALFAERAKAASAAFAITAENGPQVALLCRRLAGIPLAIELAAVRVRSLPLEQIVSRLNDRFAAGTSRATPPRQRTLRAAIDWSFDLCAPAEQTMWARMSVFAGGFELEDAEQVCAGDGIGSDEVFDLVAGLVDKSILLREGHRYLQLEPIHAYGAELLKRSGHETELRTRHQDWYRRLAARADDGWLGPDQIEWLARLQRDKGNIRAALTFCLEESGRPGTALGFVSSLWNYWIFIFGSYTEGRDYLDRALALDTEPSTERAKALWVDAWFALRRGEIDAAADLLAESRLIAERLQDTDALAVTTHFRGLIAFFRGEVPDAVTLLEEARDRYRAEDSTAGRWMALCHLVMATSTMGDYEEADAYGAQCMEMCETHSAYLSRSNALWAMGYGRWLRGDQQRAAAFLVDGLRAMRTTGDAWGVAECLEVLAWIAVADGRYERGARLLGAAQAAWRSIGASIPGMRFLVASHDRYEAVLRERLGAGRFAEALRAGGESGLEEAAAFALDEATTPDPAAAGQGMKQPLTRREMEIAELVAKGLRNKDIASTLVIAQRTAEGHVERILQKLGFTSRVQIARWVAERTAADPDHRGG